ncbi:hypothetical protein [Mesobacillus boroniphilus]|uniref:hypothetical protein n=1 Tax=Mesobacillus boroniphilus TaxID=308892 RepID=UPI001BCEB915|nr:hypothetical protein [Mesobacillus boroniphilus]
MIAIREFIHWETIEYIQITRLKSVLARSFIDKLLSNRLKDRSNLGIGHPRYLRSKTSLPVNPLINSPLLKKRFLSAIHISK